MPTIPRLLLLLLTLGGGPLAGCSLGVMTGKFLTGDPLRPAQFRTMTGTDLTKGKHKIVVVCSVPAAVEDELPSLNVDLIDGISRRMAVHGIDVVSADRVSRWIDDQGGVPEDPADIAAHFDDADYIAWLDLQAYGLREESSPKLLRGRAQGFLRAYRVEKAGSQRMPLSAFNTEFTIVFPPHQPVSNTSRSERSFQKEFLDRVCEQLSEKFYDHRPGQEI